jgi:transcription factor 4/12
MYPNDQSISSYSSNPSTPVNSPPPLTQTPGTSLSIHNSTPSTSWQQLTPANVVLNNPSTPVLNGIQNGQYAPELVHRGLHMVITINVHLY